MVEVEGCRKSDWRIGYACHTECAERNENFLRTADKLFKDTDSWTKNLKDKILQNQDYYNLLGSSRHEGISGE